MLGVLLLSEHFVVCNVEILQVVWVSNDKQKTVRKKHSDARRGFLTKSFSEYATEVGSVRLLYDSHGKLECVPNEGLREGRHKGDPSAGVHPLQVAWLEEPIVKQVHDEGFKGQKRHFVDSGRKHQYLLIDQLKSLTYPPF